MRRSAASGACALVLLLGCGADDDVGAASRRALAVVYDDDDRAEVYETRSEIASRLAHAAAVAVVPRARITSRGDGSFEVHPRTLGELLGLCAEERFADQPAAAICSGVLIAPDLVLTAAHCFAEAPCESHRFVFDYLYTAPGTLASIEADDVFACQRVVAERHAGEGDSTADFAVVRLDRPVPSRRPASLRSAAPRLGEPVTVVGFPSGLPAKVDDGATVREVPTGGDAFGLDADTFVYSSGSGVFDERGDLAGIVVRGARDYDFSGACTRTVRVAASGVKRWEDAVHVGSVVAALCAAGEPYLEPCSTRLTGCSAHDRAPAGALASLAVLALACARRVRRRRRAARPNSTPSMSPFALALRTHERRDTANAKWIGARLAARGLLQRLRLRRRDR